MKRMKKIHAVLLFVSILLLSTTVHAETVTDNTDANISFTGGTGPTNPVDPENPGQPIDPSEPVEGSLVIVAVSSFAFESGTIQAQGQFYNTITEKPNIQIADLRGTGKGWAVNVSVSSFVHEQDGQTALNGAVMHIVNGRPNSTLSNTYAPTVTTNVALSTDNVPKRLLTAEEDKGMGLWVNRFYPESMDGSYVRLELPYSVVLAGNYKATITWSLTDTP